MIVFNEHLGVGAFLESALQSMSLWRNGHLVAPTLRAEPAEKTK